jgi:hypothetical protein
MGHSCREWETGVSKGHRVRDVKEEHTLVLVLSALLRAKDELDKRERSELPQ